MKVAVKIDMDQLKVDRVVEGRNADEVVATMQKEVAAKLPLLPRMVVNAMPPVAFAQEVVKRYGAAVNRQFAAPQTCADFLNMASDAGIAVITDD